MNANQLIVKAAAGVGISLCAASALYLLAGYSMIVEDSLRFAYERRMVKEAQVIPTRRGLNTRDSRTTLMIVDKNGGSYSASTIHSGTPACLQKILAAETLLQSEKIVRLAVYELEEPTRIAKEIRQVSTKQGLVSLLECYPNKNIYPE
jgi:hypothetical protein